MLLSVTQSGVDIYVLRKKTSNSKYEDPLLATATEAPRCKSRDIVLLMGP